MIKIIIAVIIGLAVYDLLKKGIKIIFIKQQQNNLHKIINQAEKIFPLDEDFWGNK